MVALPVQHVPEQPRRLVIEIVPGRHHGELSLGGDAVEEVPLHRTADGALLHSHAASRLGDRDPLLRELHDDRRLPARRRVGEDLLLRPVGVSVDPEVDVEPLRLVSLVHQDVPEDQAVLAARHADEDTVLRGEEPELADPLRHLASEKDEEAVGAEGGVMARQVDRGLGPPATLAFHRWVQPPETTEMTSIVAPSSTRWSFVRSFFPWVTITVVGRIPASASRSITRRGPGISSSFCFWGRRTVIIRALYMVSPGTVESPPDAGYDTPKSFPPRRKSEMRVRFVVLSVVSVM